MNAEFQRIARRDKKAFLSGQCTEIKEDNRMRKTRDLFKKIRDSKGTFHAKMGSIKGRNGIDLTEAEDMKKRWQKYTEEQYKKDLQDPDSHDGVITHLEPDILEAEVKWAALNMLADLQNSAVAARLEKIQFYFQSQRKAVSKNFQTTAQLHTFHKLAK